MDHDARPSWELLQRALSETGPREKLELLKEARRLLPREYRPTRIGHVAPASASGKCASDPAITYPYRIRLCFKAKYIEPLGPDQVFRVVVDGIGIYQMTKAEFYEAFPGIVASASYQQHGLYHGANLHVRAARFRVADA